MVELKWKSDTFWTIKCWICADCSRIMEQINVIFKQSHYNIIKTIMKKKCFSGCGIKKILALNSNNLLLRLLQKENTNSLLDWPIIKEIYHNLRITFFKAFTLSFFFVDSAHFFFPWILHARPQISDNRPMPFKTVFTPVRRIVKFVRTYAIFVVPGCA